MEEKNNSIEERQNKEKTILLGNLKKIPIVHIACEKSGVGRATYYRWRKEDDNFSRLSDDAIAEGEGVINDMSEAQLISLIKDRKFAALQMWLRYHHPAYESKPKYTEPKPPPPFSLKELAKRRERLRRLNSQI